MLVVFVDVFLDVCFFVFMFLDVFLFSFLFDGFVCIDVVVGDGVCV